MKYWYDTEFYEDGERIHLISIGIVNEDGATLYLENAEFDWGIVPEDHWIQSNVRPHLTGDLVSRQFIADAVEEFVCGGPYDNRRNSLYGYYSAYDHVVLAQLFGRMVDMPKGMPWFTFDLKQMIEEDPHRLGNVADLVPHDGQEHNALVDAKWNKKLYEKIMDYSRGMY